jgi:hypothetical protein
MIKKLGSLLIVVLLVSNTGWAQTENPDSKNLTKEEKKALKLAKKDDEARKREEALVNYQTIAENKMWVLEAHTVFEKGGRSFPMNPSVNFVSVEGDVTTIQLSFNGILGWNGVGGITLEGKTTKYVVSESKNSITITMTALGSGMGPVDLLVTIGSDGSGRATASGNWGERITFAGNFVDFGDSNVYKGTPRY